MIAAPMTTRNSLSYRELAKAEAVVKRVVASDDLVRLSQATVAVGATHAEFRFGYSDRGKPFVVADLTSEASVACQWCLEPKGVELSAKFEALLAQDEDEAQRWSKEGWSQEGWSKEPSDGSKSAPEVIVAGSDFDAVRLIEDELILSLPNQVCIDQTCPNRPERQFGEEDMDGESSKRDNPFAVLQELKK